MGEGRGGERGDMCAFPHTASCVYIWITRARETGCDRKRVKIEKEAEMKKTYT